MNKELALAALEAAERSPDYDQTSWRCGTKMCYAGFVAHLAGWKWKTSQEFNLNDTPMVVKGDRFLHIEMHVEMAAMEELEIRYDQFDKLFSSWLTPKQIRWNIDLIDKETN